MAIPPKASAAPAAPPMIGAPPGGAAVDAPVEDGEEMDVEEETDDESVPLLTVFKEADGTYSLVKGDDPDTGIDDIGAADSGVDAGAGAVEGEDIDQPGRQTFDSPGALLKAILDILNEDEAAAGGEEGTADEQFEAGFGAPEPGGEKSLAQKY